MRRLAIGIAAAALVAGGGAAAVQAAAGTASSCGSAPRLRVASSAPLVLAGSGFCARERLSVRARTQGQTRTHALRASTGGSFRTRYGELAYNACRSPLRATASHDGQVIAVLSRSLRRDCKAPPGPSR
jgi:hypothetical protein